MTGSDTNNRRMIQGVVVSLLIGVASSIAVAGSGHGKGKDRNVVAVADIYECGGQKWLGRAVLVEKRSDQGVMTVDISIKVDGLSKGMHGVHIHEKGTCEPCGAAGGHFDPGPQSNSNPDGNHPFHMGDLVNINVKRNGKGKLKTRTTRVTLSPGVLSVFDENGSAFIIHDREDTFCPDGPVAGCAGASRAACGIIEPM